MKVKSQLFKNMRELFENERNYLQRHSILPTYKMLLGQIQGFWLIKEMGRRYYIQLFRTCIPETAIQVRAKDQRIIPAMRYGINLCVFLTTSKPTMIVVIGPKSPGQIMPKPTTPYFSRIWENLPFLLSSFFLPHFFKAHLFTDSPK